MVATTFILMAMVASQSVMASPNPTTTSFLGTVQENNKPPRSETLTTVTLSTATNLGTLPGDNKPCSTPVATVTASPIRGPICLPACLLPTSSCSAGEPTAPTPNPPSTSTLAPSGACTATVQVFNNPGCGNCPTCTSAPAVKPRQTTLPGHKVCSATSTVVTTVGPQTTAICACPLALTRCLPGEPTVKPLPTTTLLEGCVESIVAGPGDCSNVCPTCA